MFIDNDAGQMRNRNSPFAPEAPQNICGQIVWETILTMRQENARVNLNERYLDQYLTTEIGKWFVICLYYLAAARIATSPVGTRKQHGG